MHIGFFAVGNADPAKSLVESCQKHMPGVRIFQLTDDKTPCLDGAIAIRLEGRMPAGVRRVRHYAVLKGDWLFLDVPIKKDLRSIFNGTFDIGLCDGNQYDFSMVFSRCPRYWQYILPYLLNMPEKLQQGDGYQMLATELANQALSEFSIKVFNAPDIFGAV